MCVHVKQGVCRPRRACTTANGENQGFTKREVPVQVPVRTEQNRRNVDEIAVVDDISQKV
jgi:hypothetical protein